MNVNKYRKLIAKNLSNDFKTSIAIVEADIPKLSANQILIRNKYAGINAGFDTLSCRGEVPYVNLTPPFDLGVEAVGEIVAVGS
ncbi:MAG: alcohol dehydrogenase, partial [Phormidium sp.]